MIKVISGSSCYQERCKYLNPGPLNPALPEVLSGAELGQEEDRTYTEADCKSEVDDQTGLISQGDRVQPRQAKEMGGVALKKTPAGSTPGILASWV